MNIKILFPDGSRKEFPKGITPKEIADEISHQLALQTIVAEVNGKLVETNYKIEEDAFIVLHKFDSEKGKEVYWHSSAHLMAEAVKELFPDVKVTIGPAISEGFYYDFDKDSAFNDKDLERIEEKMKELTKNKDRYVRKEVSRDEAIKIFSDMNETYKVEILRDIPEDEIISIYQSGNFLDLCRGPHIEHAGKIKAVKLLKTAGAYWRGDEKNKMLQRIYGITFPSKKDLRKYLNDLEEAKKRDHRVLGQQLDLFSVSDNIGPGLVLWHPNGAMIRHIVEDFWKKEHLKAGYKLVNTPHIGKSGLWKTSGHLDFYEESMYSPIEVDGQEYYVKPMNCPFHIEIYKSAKRSYRELPIRYGELGTVYRYERSGALHGLMRVRGFTQDDAHIICTPDQLENEVNKLISFSFKMLKAFGFEEFDVYLSTKPEKAVGELKDWDVATESLKKALEKNEIEFKVDEGGGAFYGPKIDIKIKDALNRSWQCTTIQFDFNLPNRFEMDYVGEDNQSHRPFMIHRALLGSLERFFGTLIEYHGGNFPVWLAPVQVKVIPLSDNFEHYSMLKLGKLLDKGIRAEIDLRSEKVGYKIREAEMQKIPYMLIIGGKEEETSTVSLRKHTKGDQGTFKINEVIDMINKLVDEEKNAK